MVHSRKGWNLDPLGTIGTTGFDEPSLRARISVVEDFSDLRVAIAGPWDLADLGPWDLGLWDLGPGTWDP